MYVLWDLLGVCLLFAVTVAALLRFLWAYVHVLLHIIAPNRILILVIRAQRPTLLLTLQCPLFALVHTRLTNWLSLTTLPYKRIVLVVDESPDAFWGPGPGDVDLVVGGVLGDRSDLIQHGRCSLVDWLLLFINIPTLIREWIFAIDILPVFIEKFYVLVIRFFSFSQVTLSVSSIGVFTVIVKTVVHIPAIAYVILWSFLIVIPC